MNTRRSSLGAFAKMVYAAITAGTTQTQAGATAITTSVVKVTTGNANDGVYLPRADKPAHLGQVVIVKNASANALKVYPYKATASSATDAANEDASAYGGTIDGGSANASVTHTASLTFLYICTAANTWVSVLLS